MEKIFYQYMSLYKGEFYWFSKKVDMECWQLLLWHFTLSEEMVVLKSEKPVKFLVEKKIS